MLDQTSNIILKIKKPIARIHFYPRGFCFAETYFFLKRCHVRRWRFYCCHICLSQLQHLNHPFVPNAPFLHPLKTSENVKSFWYFQRVKKECIGNKWVKESNATMFIDVDNIVTVCVDLYIQRNFQFLLLVTIATWSEISLF